MNPEMVTLKDGSEIEGTLVKTTMITLAELLDQNLPLIYELRERCRNPDHQFFGNYGQILQDYALVDPSGNVYDSTKRVVLNAIEGEDFAMVLKSPYRTPAP